uniref:Uncharacterized protein n=1 Tax=Acanthochromis polyacanthus TaxID=80966 RepID=A0A3Q1GRZ5_9TELE
MSKGILQVHPPICDCPGCRISSPVRTAPSHTHPHTRAKYAGSFMRSSEG